MPAPNVSITTLLTPLDATVTFNEWMAALETAGVPSSSWAIGGPMRTLMQIIAATIVAAWSVIIQAIAGGFLATAQGNWLTMLAYYVYGVTRIQATYASGFITLVNGGGGLYGPFEPGEFIVFNSESGATYVNTVVFTLNPSQTLTGIAFAAQVAGDAGTSPASTIDSMQTPLPLVTISNPADFVGLNAQSDADLADLCMAKLGALSLLGPRNAYLYAIETANDNGNPVDINREIVSPSSSTGIVTVILASPDGVPIAGDITAVEANIEAVARPDTATVNVSACTVVTSVQAVTVWATTTAGLDAPTLQALIEANVTKEQQDYPIGGYVKPPSTQGYLFASFVDDWIESAHPAIYAVDGLADVAIGAGAVVELTLTYTIRFVASNAA